MKDLIFFPSFVTALAQVDSAQASWERLGIASLSIAATAFIWKYFTDKESEAKEEAKEREAKESTERKAREIADTAERNRLLGVANDLQKEVIDLLKHQSQRP